MRPLHHPRTMNYPYAAWRRLLFVAVLVVIIVIAFAPATTQGTLFLRFSSLSSSSGVNHIYVGFSQIALHQAGYLNSSGWVVISQSFSVVDLSSNQTIPATVISTPLHSGRYDQIRLVFSNSTLVRAGRPLAMSPPSMISANVTLPVAPSGIGDILLVVAFDSSTLFSSQPSLSFVLIRASAV
jgi:Domain of unknown function (DUF4382)